MEHFVRFNEKIAGISFSIFALVYLLAGILYVITHGRLDFLEIDYTDTLCIGPGMGFNSCEAYVKENRGEICSCTIALRLQKSISRTVYIYYELANFYQNHRRYTESQDHYQQLGLSKSLEQANHRCNPYRKREGKVVVPCGAMANSLFNDSIEIWFIKQDSVLENVPLRRFNIAWKSHKDRKFKNPPDFESSPRDAFNDTIQPENWQRPIYELDLQNITNNGFQNEDYIVWMSISTLPTFRKLFRVVMHERGSFKNGLPQGLYELRINYSYPVSDFAGRKKILITNVGPLGGKNNFLGVVSIVLGVLMLLGAFIILIDMNWYKIEARISQFFSRRKTTDAWAPEKTVSRSEEGG